MDFSLTDDQQLLRDTAAKLLDRECPPALVRAHIDDPSVYEPLWRHLREYTALGAGPATDLCLFLEQTGYAAAPGPFLATALYASLTGDDETHGHGRVRRRPDEPVRARSRPRRADRDRRPRPPLAVVDTDGVRDRLRFVATVDFSRRVFQLDTDDLDLDGAAARPRALRRVARPRARVDRGRDDRHRAAHLRHVARVREGARAVRPCRSARSRRSSTSSPTCRSRSSGRPPRCSTRR